MQELLNIVGFHIPLNKKIADDKLAASVGQPPEARLSFDSRLYSIGISYTEKYKQNSYANKTRRSDYLNTILQVLTPDDIRQLIIYEDELTQAKSFQKIFPTHNTYKYFRFFEKPRYYNQLLDAWEHKYHGCREKGVQLLKSYCEKGLHLRTASRIIGKERTWGVLFEDLRIYQRRILTRTCFDDVFVIHSLSWWTIRASERSTGLR